MAVKTAGVKKQTYLPGDLVESISVWQLRTGEELNYSELLQAAVRQAIGERAPVDVQAEQLEIVLHRLAEVEGKLKGLESGQKRVNSRLTKIEKARG